LETTATENIVCLDRRGSTFAKAMADMLFFTVLDF